MAIRDKTRIALSFAVFLGLVPLAGSGRLSDRSRTADLLLLNAHIVTMDRTQPTAQAMAIQEDRIVSLGGNEEAQRCSLEPLALLICMVQPGIIDAHTHLVSLGESLLRLNLKDVATEEEVVERVKQKAASTAPNEWIFWVGAGTKANGPPATQQMMP